MKLRKAAAAPALALAVLVGCQGGDAADSVATAYSATAKYGDDDRHPITATNNDALAREAENELEMLVNAHRNALGLNGLLVTPELKDLALAHSVHMGRHEPAFFDHRSPEGDLPENRATLGGIEYTSIGENIAAGQSAAELVMKNWLYSPGHRANLEDPKWTHMGAGHAFLPDSPYVTYWTLDLIERR